MTHKKDYHKTEKNKDPIIYYEESFKKKWKNFNKNIFTPSWKTRTVIYGSVAILCCMIFLGGYLYGHVQNVNFKRTVAEQEREQRVLQFESEHVGDIATIQENTSIDAWKEFKSQWYGFVIKYPADWVVRTVTPTAEKKAAVYRVGFYKPSDKCAVDEVQIGFEVAVYDLAKTKELSTTDEFPVIIDPAQKESGVCKTISGHLYETSDYPAEEIYIPAGDNCYASTLFYSNIVGQYMYTIVPVITGEDMPHDVMVAATDRVLEFFAAASQFSNIDIVRPKPKPVAPRISAPMPATYTKDAIGRLVCEKKNDKPGKSKENNKGKRHMDMECCLDPDEYPNPHCYYDPGKYGKYLGQ